MDGRGDGRERRVRAFNGGVRPAARRLSSCHWNSGWVTFSLPIADWNGVLRGVRFVMTFGDVLFDADEVEGGILAITQEMSS
jgi:hypothetical protein